MQKLIESRKKEEGFTLIELLIAIVVVGILTAVAIVGIAGLTDKGSSSACSATKDAIKSAQAVHFANNDGTYPTDLKSMTTTTPPELELSGGSKFAAAPDDATTIVGKGWTLKGTGTGSAPLTITTTGSCG